MLHFHKQNKELALRVFRESKENGELYRFGNVCDKVTEWVLKAVKKGKLNALVEDRPSTQAVEYSDQKHAFVETTQKLFVGFLYK